MAVEGRLLPYSLDRPFGRVTVAAEDHTLVLGEQVGAGFLQRLAALELLRDLAHAVGEGRVDLRRGGVVERSRGRSGGGSVWALRRWHPWAPQLTMAIGKAQFWLEPTARNSNLG